MADEFTNEYNADDVLRPEWTPDGHLDEGTIHTWLDGAFDDASAALVQTHVDGCATCRSAVAEARGFIAGASRVTRALDAVPSEVVPTSDVERVAARIVAAAAMPAAAMPVAAMSAAAMSAAALPARDATRVEPRVPRRAWYQSPMWRAAAALAVTVGGGAIVLRERGTPSVTEVATTAKQADAVAASPPPAPAASAPVSADGRALPQPATVADNASRSKASEPARTAAVDSIAVVSDRADVAAESKKAERGASASGNVQRLSETVMAVPAPPIPAAAPPASLAGKVAGARVATAARDEGTRLSGEVVTSDGKPIAGANVVVQGTSAGSTTDALGRFSLTSPVDSGTLMVRRLGFQPVRVPIARAKDDTTLLRVPLTQAVQSLESVVVSSEAQARKGASLGLSYSSAANAALPSVATCWRVIVTGDATGDATSLGVPVFLQLPPLVAASTVDVRWFGWPRRGVNRTVRTLLDAAGGLTGRATVEGTSLQLVLTRTTDGWIGTAISQQGGTRREGAIVLTGVPDVMCQP